MIGYVTQDRPDLAATARPLSERMASLLASRVPFGILHITLEGC